MDCSASKLQTSGSGEYRITVKPKQFEYRCTMCARDGIEVDARTLCKACRDCLCLKCLQWHSQHRFDHVEAGVGVDSMRKMRFLGPAVMPSKKCLVHAGEMCTMFCLKDSVAGCKRCMEEEHKYARVHSKYYTLNIHRFIAIK